MYCHTKSGLTTPCLVEGSRAEGRRKKTSTEKGVSKADLVSGSIIQWHTLLGDLCTLHLILSKCLKELNIRNFA
jgi:hypothetical protein